MIRQLAVSAVILALASTSAVARQAVGNDTLSLRLKQAQTENQIVRLRSLSGAESVGRVATVTDSTVRVDRQTLRFVDQSSFEARISHADPIWNGILIGAIANLVVSYPLWSSFAASMAERDLQGREKLSIAVGSVLFGAALGGGIDAARERRPEWRLVWSRELRRDVPTRGFGCMGSGLYHGFAGCSGWVLAPCCGGLADCASDH